MKKSRGPHGAVADDCIGYCERPRPGPCVQRSFQRNRQRFGSRRRSVVCRADPEIPDSARPVRLISDLRDDYLRSTRPRGSRRRAGAAVVDDRGHSRKQRLLVDLADDKAVVVVVDERKLGPAARKQNAATLRTHDIDRCPCKLFRRGETAESDVDGRRTGIEE